MTSCPIDEENDRPAVSAGSRSAATIVVREVEMQYNTPDGGVLALDKVSFDVRGGEFISIVGPSGCGKSTLLLIIAGLIAPSAGVVTVQGKIVDRAISDSWLRVSE